MNIGIFTDTYFPQINGVATSVMTLSEELRKMGHNVYIFTPNDTGVDKNEDFVYRLPSMPFIFSKNHRMTLIYPPKLLLTFRRLRLDIVHTQTEFAMGFLGYIVSEFYNIPKIHTYHTMYEDYVHYILNGHLITKNGAKRFSRIFCNRANRVIAPAKKTECSLLEYGVKKEIDIIPTGLYLDRYLNETPQDELLEIKKSLGISPDKKVLLCLGRIAKEKSLDVVIYGFSKIADKQKDAVLLIVGGGPYLDNLKELTATLGITDKVIFTGFVPNIDIHKYYKLGDMFITASTSETQGLTYIEAMASKMPVLVKKDNCIENVITHDYNGYVFENNDDLPDMMIDLLNNKEKQEKFVANSLAIAKKYNASTFATDILVAYTKTIEQFEPKMITKITKNIRGKINWKK